MRSYSIGTDSHNCFFFKIWFLLQNIVSRLSGIGYALCVFVNTKYTQSTRTFDHKNRARGTCVDVERTVVVLVRMILLYLISSDWSAEKWMPKWTSSIWWTHYSSISKIVRAFVDGIIARLRAAKAECCFIERWKCGRWFYRLHNMLAAHILKSFAVFVGRGMCAMCVIELPFCMCLFIQTRHRRMCSSFCCRAAKLGSINFNINGFSFAQTPNPNDIFSSITLLSDSQTLTRHDSRRGNFHSADCISIDMISF